jgi:hypothetical protein
MYGPRRHCHVSLATAAASLAACVSTGVPLSQLLDSAVGQPLSSTRWSAAVLDMRLVSDDGAEREYEGRFANGCGYAIVINTATSQVIRWRFTENPPACESISTHSALGS